MRGIFISPHNLAGNVTGEQGPAAGRWFKLEPVLIASVAHVEYLYHFLAFLDQTAQTAVFEVQFRVAKLHTGREGSSLAKDVASYVNWLVDSTRHIRLLLRFF